MYACTCEKKLSFLWMKSSLNITSLKFLKYNSMFSLCIKFFVLSNEVAMMNFTHISGVTELGELLGLGPHPPISVSPD